MSTVFEVLIDDLFENVSLKADLTPIDNKRVLSLVNGFEDGKWRLEDFHNYIWDNIAETALSAKERASLSEKRLTSLVRAAKNLRLVDEEAKDAGEGSELAEIFLYGLMKDHFKALPVVPKIFYKQNVNDFAKGSDSVHIVLEAEDEFSLWFGEAKFYSSIENVRLGKIISSVEESLTKEKLKKENAIITNVADIDELDIRPETKLRIKSLLSTDTSIDDIKPRLCIPILLLHECEITRDCNKMSDDYRDKIKKFHKERATEYFRKQIKKLASKVNQYSEIKFHIILVPVPSKSSIVKKFIARARNLRDE